jgi:hypothetical protein
MASVISICLPVIVTIIAIVSYKKSCRVLPWLFKSFNFSTSKAILHSRRNDLAAVIRLNPSPAAKPIDKVPFRGYSTATTVVERQLFFAGNVHPKIEQKIVRATDYTPQDKVCPITIRLNACFILCKDITLRKNPDCQDRRQ